MNRSKWIGQLALSLFSVCWTTTASSVNNSTDFGYDVLAKLSYLENKLQELQMQAKEETVNQNKFQRELLGQTSEILEQQKILTNHEKIITDSNRLLTVLIDRQMSVKSCVEKWMRSGRYRLTVSDSTNFEVYCEQTLHGGGWIVIQNRFDGSVDFFRNWTDYRNGFGSLDGEFWLGLEKTHQLTSTATYELLVHLEDHDGVKKYAKYAKFAIEGESEKYSLKTLEPYSGTAGDSLNFHEGMTFSTHDEDNDKSSKNCALLYHGGWWYKSCHSSNLNGPYKKGDDPDTMTWYKFHNNHQGLKVSKMMIRET